ncbi:MAG: UDP-N-acetylmuramoyl-tripeptide--D-alanyl-D-alanine ligase [Lachnospiraceae bacterium]
MKNMTLANIAKAVGGTYFGSKEQECVEVQGVVIDSRQVEKGYLFVAIVGEKVDGHTFIPSVFQKGAAAVLSQQKPENPTGPYILVKSTEQALKDLAAFYRRQLDVKVVGISGSVGKTSTKEMIASVLSQKYNVLKTAGNFNNEIGLPLTIFRIRPEHEIAVLEMGISDFDEMHRLAHVAQPDIGTITNIGLCHLENLKTRDGILQAKTEMFDHLTSDACVVLNGDDDKLAGVSEVNGKAPLFYGILPENTDTAEPPVSEHGAVLSAYAADMHQSGLSAMEAALHIGTECIDVRIPIAGVHNVQNALAAALIGKQFGLTMEQIKAGIEQVETLSGHSNIISVNDLTILDDCYNANPVSMKAAISVLSHADGRKIAVLGDMGELGNDEKQLHYEVGEFLAAHPVDALFTAGTLIREAVKAVEMAETPCEIYTFETVKDLIKALLSYKQKGDTILVKASHFMEFPQIVEALKKEH